MAGCRSVRAKTLAADLAALIRKIITCDFNLVSKQRPNATDKQWLVCQLLTTPTQTYSESVQFDCCKDCGKIKSPIIHQTWASPDVPSGSIYDHRVTDTTRIHTPLHQCTHYTPNDWAYKAGKQALFTDHDSISASCGLQETSGFGQTQTEAVITTYHGNYAFRAAASVSSQHAGPSCPSKQGDLVVKRACRQDTGLDWL